jgi:chorismate synthase
MSRRKPVSQQSLPKEKNRMTFNFCQVFSKVKPQELQSDLLFQIPIKKSDDYSHIKDNYRPSHADYVYEKNMECVITVAVVVVLLVKLQ